MKIAQYIYDFHQINKQHVKFHLQPKKTKPTASPGDAQIDAHSLYTLGDLIRTWGQARFMYFCLYIHQKKKKEKQKQAAGHTPMCVSAHTATLQINFAYVKFMYSLS